MVARSLLLVALLVAHRSCDPDTNGGAQRRGAGHVILRAAALESCPIGCRILGYPAASNVYPLPGKKNDQGDKQSYGDLFFDFLVNKKINPISSYLLRLAAQHLRQLGSEMTIRNIC